MHDVLALLDASDHASTVAEAATAIARRRHVTAHALHVRAVREAGRRPSAPPGLVLSIVPGDAVEQILRRAADPEVDLVVLGARDDPADERATGHIALAVLDRLNTPCMVVPPSARLPNGGSSRALLHVEPDIGMHDAVRVAEGLLGDAGFALSALHVFDATTTPRFWDQAAHGAQSWAAALIDRIDPTTTVDVDVCTGATAESLLAVAAEQDVDIIAICWPRPGLPQRDAAVRELLRRAPVPVLLIPIRSGRRHGT